MADQNHVESASNQIKKAANEAAVGKAKDLLKKRVEAVKAVANIDGQLKALAEDTAAEITAIEAGVAGVK